MANTCKLTLLHGNSAEHFQCSWRKNRSLADNVYFESADIIFQVVNSPNLDSLEPIIRQYSPRIFITQSPHQSAIEIKQLDLGDGGLPAFNLLVAALRSCKSAPKSYQQCVKLIIPISEGELIRSDIFNLRFVDCPSVDTIVCFSQLGRHFTEAPKSPILPSKLQLLEVFSEACAGVILQPSQSGKSDLAALDLEFERRLSFPWLMKKKRQRRTMVIVDGGKNLETGRNFYAAADALDIALIVLDRPGHWLEGPEFASLRLEFIPFDRSLDAGLSSRIFSALELYGKQPAAAKIDGLVTFFDPMCAAVARVAERLKLPSSSPEAYEIATDKFKTGIAEGRPTYLVSSPEEVDSICREAQDLSYPLIVKPCSGWGSEGVFRVGNEKELKDAVDSIDFVRHGRNVTIEEYCEGPEVDANLVLVDGDVVFFEASDDFPKAADTPDGEPLKTFIEVANVLPSILPSTEQSILKTSLHQCLLSLGFKNGFFHLEARIKHSSVEYRKDETCDIIDLRTKEPKLDVPPGIWLIEINPRPPGVQGLLASARTYGVDYIGIALSLALHESNTVRALSIPFQNGVASTGAQYWCEIVFIPVVQGGVFGSNDVCADLCTRRRDLAKHISRSYCFFKKGESVKDPTSGILSWIAYYLVYSREGRQCVLELAESVRRETKFVVVR